jgi:uncharacterized protein YdeI (YjbR/CyaY-like superfamily)
MTAAGTEPAVPPDLRAALAADCAIEAAWRDITPLARRDFIMWIEGAKKLETRAKRIAVACDKLARGDRRPCCYAVVPLDLHNALKADPAAKAQWSSLDGESRRDWIAWLEQAPDKAERQARVGQACSRIAAGKSQP